MCLAPNHIGLQMSNWQYEGMTDKANMPSYTERQTAVRAAIGSGSSGPVSVTVKDGAGEPLTRTMQQDQYVAWLAGFQV